MGLPDDAETDAFMKRLLGHDYNWHDKMNIPLLIHVPGTTSEFTKKVQLAKRYCPTNLNK